MISPFLAVALTLAQPRAKTDALWRGTEVTKRPMVAVDVPVIEPAAPVDPPTPTGQIDVYFGHKGSTMPEDGCFIPTSSCLSLAQEHADSQATIGTLAARPRWWMVGAAGLVGLAVGGLTAFALFHH